MVVGIAANPFGAHQAGRHMDQPHVRLLQPHMDGGMDVRSCTFRTSIMILLLTEVVAVPSQIRDRWQ